ncbi:hypothetical protein QQP08_018759, partial [Theobroma cacao]
PRSSNLNHQIPKNYEHSIPRTQSNQNRGSAQINERNQGKSYLQALVGSQSKSGNMFDPPQPPPPPPLNCSVNNLLSGTIVQTEDHQAQQRHHDPNPVLEEEPSIEPNPSSPLSDTVC